MINKQIITATWDDLPSTFLMNVGSKGVDKCQFQKCASSEELTKDVKPEKGYSFVHVISTGSGEFFGANSNADYYNEKGRDYTFCSPCNSMQKTAKLCGGLEEFHCTYMKFGGVYREHKNGRKGFKPDGDVFKEAYNTNRHRGELILKLSNDIWADDLQKIANKEVVSWSIGAGVPYDICSVCGNKAKSRNEYCEHLRYNKLGLDKEGRQICALNDQPHFHDISRVSNPADKIALTLQKVASRNSLLFGDFVRDATDGLYLPLSLLEKIGTGKEKSRLALIQKLAKLEKELKVCPKLMEDVGDALTLDNDEEDEVVKSLENEDIKKLFAGLENKNMMLTPNTFIRIVIKKRPESIDNVVNLPGALKTVFNDILNDGSLEDVLNDGSFSSIGSSSDTSLNGKLNELSELLSLDSAPVQHRIIKITVMPKKNKGKIEKESNTGEPSMEAKILAREYAKYQLSFLARSKEENLKLAVLRKR
jgi:hypothetical protein